MKDSLIKYPLLLAGDLSHQLIVKGFEGYSVTNKHSLIT